MSEKIKLLVADDEDRLLQTLTHRLRLREFDVFEEVADLIRGGGSAE